jgi:hypothetical protein
MLPPALQPALDIGTDTPAEDAGAKEKLRRPRL